MLRYESGNTDCISATRSFLMCKSVASLIVNHVDRWLVHPWSLGSQLKSGAQFGAWIGLTPRQHSRGGKNSLGGITKRGDNYLRSLLIQGAKSAVMTAHMRSDPISLWTAALRERLGWQKAAVALANKNARILWAVMTRGEAFNPRHISVKPGASTPSPATA